MKDYHSQNDVIQNLKDANCDELTIGQFMEALQSGKENQGIQLLQKHRRSLLENLHKSQKQIDCLDYLLFMMKV